MAIGTSLMTMALPGQNKEKLQAIMVKTVKMEQTVRTDKTELMDKTA